MNASHGHELASRLAAGRPLPAIGIFDMMSALVASRHPNTEALFLSGLGYTLSSLGWPDQGFLDGASVVDWVTRVRDNHPDKHLLVDIDGGLGNAHVLSRVVRSLERAGASAFTLEDQDDEAKRCGHLAGKKVVPLDVYSRKLEVALDYCGDTLVIARTDSTNFEDALQRVRRFVEIGAPIVLVDGLDEPQKLMRIKEAAGDAHVMVNLIAGGKMGPVTMSELYGYGASIVNFSTPLSDPALQAMEASLDQLYSADGRLPERPHFGLQRYVELVQDTWQQFLSRARGRARMRGRVGA